MARTKKFREAGVGSREYELSSMRQPGQLVIAEAAAVLRLIFLNCSILAYAFSGFKVMDVLATIKGCYQVDHNCGKLHLILPGPFMVCTACLSVIHYLRGVLRLHRRQVCTVVFSASWKWEIRRRIS